MMGMGMEVENFAPYRSIRFSVKTRLWERTFVFRLFDRSEAGWIGISQILKQTDWFNVVLSVPPDSGKWLDIRRIGGVMFELRARDESVTGEVFLDGLELRGSKQGQPMLRFDWTAYALNPPRLEIPQAHAQKMLSSSSTCLRLSCLYGTTIMRRRCGVLTRARRLQFKAWCRLY